MTVADEADFSLHLRAGVERVAILDGKDGPDGRPFEIASISDASGPQAWIFERRDDAPLQWKSLLGELARSLMRATRTNVWTATDYVYADSNGDIANGNFNLTCQDNDDQWFLGYDVHTGTTCGYWYVNEDCTE